MKKQRFFMTQEGTRKYVFKIISKKRFFDELIIENMR